MVLRAIMKELLLWFIAIMIFLSILFMPRTTTYITGEGGMFVGAKYDYSFQTHVQMFKDFFTM